MSVSGRQKVSSPRNYDNHVSYRLRKERTDVLTRYVLQFLLRGRLLSPSEEDSREDA